MNVDTIREFCLEFPEATENLQWGDDLCFKISGKIFAKAPGKKLKKKPKKLSKRAPAKKAKRV
jgi:predicted DNA-binding protein (MmcQ/YjbR family)